MLVNSGVYPKQPPGLVLFFHWNSRDQRLPQPLHVCHSRCAPLKELKDAMTEVGAKLVEARLLEDMIYLAKLPTELSRRLVTF